MNKDYAQGDAPLDVYSAGGIVGRFQVPELTEGHIDLFDYVCSRHEKVYLYLGLSPIVDPQNFLDFHQRKVMIQEKYPNVQIFYIKDTMENSDWSETLDRQISDVMIPMQKILLYGSRDSFIKSYRDGNGKYDTEEFTPKRIISATEIRKKLSKSLISNYFVRVGMFLASIMRYATGYVTVDIAVMDNNRENIWLGRKKGETKFRLLGGFNDPEKSNTLEDDAKREVMEESHIVLSEPKYLYSTIVDDWRYRRSRDKIKTTLWIGDRIGGDPQPDDDIVELKKYPITDFIWEDGYAPILEELKNGDQIFAGHHPLMLKLVEYLSKK